MKQYYLFIQSWFLPSVLVVMGLFYAIPTSA